MPRHAILPLAFTVAILASAEPPAASTGKSAGVFFDSREKSSAKAKADSDGAYELRGFFGAGENLEVSVRRAGAPQSVWLRVGKKSGDLLVEKADAKTGTATLLAGGRRVVLRLAGESAPAMPVVITATATTTPATASNFKSEAYREKRFEELRAKMSDAQEAEFGRVMMERHAKLRAENPNLDFHDPKNAGKLLEMRVAMMREASEAAHKLPDKEGNITPVAADFEPLVREHFAAEMEERQARRAEREKTTELQKTGSGTITLSGGSNYSGATTVQTGTLSGSGGETPSNPGR